MKLSEHVRSTHDEDGAVVLDILHGQMFRLNVVGSRMLDLLKQGMTEAQIASAISRESGAPQEIVAADLQEFLDHLKRNRLLEIRRTTSESGV
jgi:hypothetical protein